MEITRRGFFSSLLALGIMAARPVAGKAAATVGRYVSDDEFVINGCIIPGTTSIRLCKETKSIQIKDSIFMPDSHLLVWHPSDKKPHIDIVGNIFHGKLEFAVLKHNGYDCLVLSAAK